jgi:hypothetical protein
MRRTLGADYIEFKAFLLKNGCAVRANILQTRARPRTFAGNPLAIRASPLTRPLPNVETPALTCVGLGSFYPGRKAAIDAPSTEVAEETNDLHLT